MTILTKNWPPLLTIVISALGGFFALPYLPERIPVHWGFYGNISSYTSKGVGVYLNPAGMAFAYLFFFLIPYTDKRRVLELRELGVYEPIRNTAIYAFGFAQLLVIGIGLDIINPSANYLAGLVCLLVIFGAGTTRSEQFGPIRESLPILNRFAVGFPTHVARRMQIAAGIGVLGALFGTYQILWFIIPAALVILVEVWQKRSST